jgi:predicted transcriptional regulator
MRETGINRGTLYYHIYKLRLMGAIREVNDGGLTRYYIHLGKQSPLEQKLVTHQDNPLRDRILLTLQEKGPVPRSELKKDLGVSGPALWYHMHLLLNDGIVYAGQAKEVVGKPLIYSLTRNAADILEQSGSSGSMALQTHSLPSSPVAGYFTADNRPKTDEKMKVHE